MYNMDLPEDQATKKAVERRRSAETARKARIYNTRLRVMGLDVNALNKQVEEKKHRREMEMQREKAFDKLMQHRDDLIVQQDIRERHDRAALHTSLTQHWATHQRAEDSRDADLKCGLKGAFRTTAPDSALGPASMQVFQGEGVGEERKRKEQMKKTERELQAQREDSVRRIMREKQREMLMSKELAHQDIRGVQMCALEEECKRAACVALSNYNQALAAERAENTKEEQRREERENLSEILHTLTSDMMTEAAHAEPGGGGRRRVAVDRWKGMSPEQQSAIHRDREKQCLERQRQREAERAQDAAWNLQLLKLSRAAEEEEERQAALTRAKRIQMDHYNMQLAREQQAAQEHLNKTVYTNKPTKHYFHQFNTGSR